MLVPAIAHFAGSGLKCEWPGAHALGFMLSPRFAGFKRSSYFGWSTSVFLVAFSTAASVKGKVRGVTARQSAS